MKVYVLESSVRSESHLIGVFSSIEKAIEARDVDIKTYGEAISEFRHEPDACGEMNNMEIRLMGSMFVNGDDFNCGVSYWLYGVQVDDIIQGIY